ncbi:hypothetical protein DFJ74DRAFT_770413 [Hyaloraphidium curvatum]|nr:hypothetical protein DFJ74DRAFT_770413 [Hyaloraphidium curvatum]
MRAALAALTPFFALLAVAAPALGAPAASSPAIFVRSCDECDTNQYCEFSHPGASSEAPLACVSYTDGHSLYRRYDYTGNCLDRPGLDAKFYYESASGSYCWWFSEQGGAWKLNIAEGTCPQSTPLVAFDVVAASGSAPGTCWTASPNGVQFGPGCNSFVMHGGSESCGGATGTIPITVPFA